MFIVSLSMMIHITPYFQFIFSITFYPLCLFIPLLKSKQSELTKTVQDKNRALKHSQEIESKQNIRLLSTTYILALALAFYTPLVSSAHQIQLNNRMEDIGIYLGM